MSLLCSHNMTGEKIIFMSRSLGHFHIRMLKRGSIVERIMPLEALRHNRLAMDERFAQRRGSVEFGQRSRLQQFLVALQRLVLVRFDLSGDVLAAQLRRFRLRVDELRRLSHVVRVVGRYGQLLQLLVFTPRLQHRFFLFFLVHFGAITPSSIATV